MDAKHEKTSLFLCKRLEPRREYQKIGEKKSNNIIKKYYLNC